MRCFLILIFAMLVFIPKSYALYAKNYMVYDDTGLVQVNCMRCNKVIKRRDYKEVILRNGNKVYAQVLKTLPNFNQVSVDILNTNSYTNILLCTKCMRKYQMTPSEMEGMSRQLQNGWVLEAQGNRQPPDIVEEIRKRNKKIKVKGNHKGKERNH